MHGVSLARAIIERCCSQPRSVCWLGFMVSGLARANSLLLRHGGGGCHQGGMNMLIGTSGCKKIFRRSWGSLYCLFEILSSVSVNFVTTPFRHLTTRELLPQPRNSLGNTLSVHTMHTSRPVTSVLLVARGFWIHPDMHRC